MWPKWFIFSECGLLFIYNCPCHTSWFKGHTTEHVHKIEYARESKATQTEEEKMFGSRISAGIR